MNIRKILLSLACTTLVALPALAQHEGHGEQPMPPEMAAMMEAWANAAAVGPQHVDLAKMAGNWKLTVKSWMDPSAPPQVSTGTATRTMMLGGRYLSETVKSEMMGAAFEGFGLTGYDNVGGQWWATWCDNMGTGLMLMKGTHDAATHTMTMTGEYLDPVTKQPAKMEIVSRQEGADKEVAEFYDWKTGSRVKMMEIVYERM